jgi:glycosyltransferase involved in cell wall biosynthesis
MPLVSIVLPTFNRARFLPEAFAAIAAQEWSDWELILVDDGSTDETPKIVEEWVAAMRQPVRFIRQQNMGAYGARNTALDYATGDYIAFFDSDDLWLPHHLDRCVRQLEANRDVDWVYGACRMADFDSGRELAASTFRVNGAPRRFMSLPTDTRGDLHVLRGDDVIPCALLHGLYCGLQNSVFRREVFDGLRFKTTFRNEAEDQLFVIRVLKRGHAIGYLDDVHVIYRVHASNSSGSATGPNSFDRQFTLMEPVARGFRELRSECSLTSRENAALRRRLHREYVWHLGYATCRAHGRNQQALHYYHKGIVEWPWSLRAWTTYVAGHVRAFAQ